MTWIVGIAPPFGYSILVSDIRVAFTDNHGKRSYLDCLQKIYPLGRFVLGGFAGSVKIGFRLLARLEFESSQLGEDEAWDVDVISHTWWPRLAKRIFDQSEDHEKQLGSQIILATARPTRNRGDAPWPWTDIYTFSAPKFEPREANCLEVLSIGSGSRIPQYVDAIREACSDFSFLELVQLGDAVQATFIAREVGEAVEKAPAAGISPLFQVGVVTRGNYAIANHEYSVFSENGTRTAVRFPHLAKNYRERVAELSRHI